MVKMKKIIMILPLIIAITILPLLLLLLTATTSTTKGFNDKKSHLTIFVRTNPALSPLACDW